MSVARKQKPSRGGAFVSCEANEDQANRLLFGSTIRPRDPCYAYAKGCTRTASYTCSHSFSYFGAHCSVSLDQRWRHTEQANLCLVRVGNNSFNEIVRTSRNVSQ